MSFNDRSANTESYPCAGRFGCEEWIKNAIHIRAIDADILRDLTDRDFEKLGRPMPTFYTKGKAA